MSEDKSDNDGRNESASDGTPATSEPAEGGDASQGATSAPSDADASSSDASSSDASSSDAARNADASTSASRAADPKPSKGGPKKSKKKPSRDEGDEDHRAVEPPRSEEAEPAAAPSVPRRHYQLSGALLAVGAIGMFLLMANVQQLPHGTLVGLAALLLAVCGVLGLAGLTRPDPKAISWKSTTLGALEGEHSAFALGKTLPASFVLLVLGGAIGGFEALPYVISLCLALLLPSALRRPGVLAFVVIGAIYLPLLGTWSLWDPWETHYGEVAREIIARDDWISLWWAQENWFWSKPIAIFWSEAFWLSALDIDVSPDANPLHSEWAIRIPVVLVSMAALMVVYATVRRIFSARAGVLAAITMATAPHFFFLSHQAITDMYLVANLVMAVCMLILAFAEDPKREVQSYRAFGVDVSLQHVVLGGIVLLALPQAMYLLTRNIEFFPSEGFRVHADSFLYGSAGNAGVPGNADHRDVTPHITELQPVLQGLLWLAVLAIIVLVLRRERRVQALYMYAFYAFCAIAFMGKGIPGFALPGLVALLYLVASRRWSLLFDGQLRIAPGILVVLSVGFPWYVAMFIRHGPGFSDRLLVHDHINRLAQGVHGDTGSIQYFLLQLGYATFPWVGLIPAAVLGWLWYQRVSSREPRPEMGPYRSAVEELPAERQHRNQRETITLVGLWFFSSFALFSAMITKFHHYIFPAVPPAMFLAGIMLDRMWGEIGDGGSRPALRATLAAIAAPVLLVLGIAGLWGDLRGVIPEEVPAPARQDWVLDHGLSPAVCYALLLLGAALLTWSGRWLWHHRMSIASSEESQREELSMSIAVGAGTALLAFVARDLSWITDARPHGFERLIHLFVYNYGRPWPDHFDYRPIMTGFALVAGVLFALAALRWSRPAAARALVGLSIMFSAWTLNVYMIDLSPHWGMGPLFRKYYEVRSSDAEPVIAWQMNWKGENFYTGNRVYAFVDLDNVKLREWMNNNRGKTAFFALEHSRMSSFRSLMAGKEVEEVTTLRDNNKFILVRVPAL